MEFFKEHSFVIAQIIGFCAMATAIISFQQKKRTNIMIFQLICTALWSLHFFVLGNMPGCALNGIMTLRCVIYYFKETQKWAQHKVWLVLFLIAGFVAGVLTGKAGGACCRFWVWLFPPLRCGSKIRSTYAF